MALARSPEGTGLRGQTCMMSATNSVATEQNCDVTTIPSSSGELNGVVRTSSAKKKTEMTKLRTSRAAAPKRTCQSTHGRCDECCLGH